MVSDLALPGLKLIQLKFFHDPRGFFTERYKKVQFEQLGIPGEFIQDNHSFSLPGVIRGLHYQHSPAQGKLVSVIRGKIWDVVVDLRQKSSTYGKWTGVELSESNGHVLWVPPGFAHGFCVVGDGPADVLYKVDAPYSPKTESGIAFDDPDLKIVWPISNPILSDKDRALPRFKDYATRAVF